MSSCCREACQLARGGMLKGEESECQDQKDVNPTQQGIDSSRSETGNPSLDPLSPVEHFLLQMSATDVKE